MAGEWGAEGPSFSLLPPISQFPHPESQIPPPKSRIVPVSSDVPSPFPFAGSGEKKGRALFSPPYPFGILRH